MNVWYVQQNSFVFFKCFGTLWALYQFFSLVEAFHVIVKVTLICKGFRTKFAHQWLFTDMLQHMSLTHWPPERFRAYLTLFLVFFVHFRMSQETLLLIEYLLAYITFILFHLDFGSALACVFSNQWNLAGKADKMFFYPFQKPIEYWRSYTMGYRVLVSPPLLRLHSNMANLFANIFEESKSEKRNKSQFVICVWSVVNMNMKFLKCILATFL